MFDSIPDQYNTQEMCDKAVSKEVFTLKYCPDRYKTQWMCKNAVDAYLSALKFVPEWLVTNKILQMLNDVV